MRNILPRLFKRNQHYSHINSQGRKYWLYYTDVKLRAGNKTRIYFFALTDDKHKTMQTDVGKVIHPAALPSDRTVRENPRNGFLTIARKNGLDYEQ